MDLLDFFRGKHSWRKLENLIGRLPRASAFMQARLDDPEVVEYLLSQPDPPPYRPQVEEFTPELGVLYDMADQLGALIAAVYETSPRHKAPKIKPLLRPITGVERARSQKEKRRHLSLVDEVKAAQARWEASRSL